MVQTIPDYVRNKKTGKLVGLWGLRGIIQKQGVGFPEMEKKWFGGPQHLNPHMDRLGLYRTRAEQVLGHAAPQGNVVCM